MKLRTAELEQQVVPCRAGTLTGVVYANGDVGVYEQRDILGNIRKQKFSEISTSHLAEEARRSFRCKECYSTNEIFMWPSIVFQPVHLDKSLALAKIWQ